MEQVVMMTASGPVKVPIATAISRKIAVAAATTLVKVPALNHSRLNSVIRYG